MTCRLWRPRTSAAAIWPERNGSSPSVSAARPQSGVRRMLTVGPRRMLKPFATASSPTAAPKRCASVVSHEAARTCAFGNAVRGGEPFRTPFGPSVGASAGMPRRGTPAPPVATSEIFSSRVICARSALACLRGVGRGAATPGDDAAPAAMRAARASTGNRRQVGFTRRGYAGGSFAVNQNCAVSALRRASLRDSVATVQIDVVAVRLGLLERHAVLLLLPGACVDHDVALGAPGLQIAAVAHLAAIDAIGAAPIRVARP